MVNYLSSKQAIRVQVSLLAFCFYKKKVNEIIQWVEWRDHNPNVVSSILTLVKGLYTTKFKMVLFYWLVKLLFGYEDNLIA
jgi:hypothetical protein